MTKDDVMEVFLDLQDEIPPVITVQLGRFDQTGALGVSLAGNEQADDVMLNFKASGNQEQLDRLLTELRSGLGRFLTHYDQYRGEVSCIVRLRNEER